MKEIIISKQKVKDYLARIQATYLMQADEEILFKHIRHEGLEGYEKKHDLKLFEELIFEIPEFKLLELVRADKEFFIVSVKKEYQNSEDEILVDIKRIIQMRL